MIIVFGAAGFIGTYLVERLIVEGYAVLASDIDEIGEAYYGKQGLPYIRFDITQKDDFKRLPRDGVEAVIHLACVQPGQM